MPFAVSRMLMAYRRGPWLKGYLCWGGMISFLVCSLAGPSAQAEDWPQFRGHNASGVSLESRHLPVHFSTTENVAWSADVGEGVACPIIVQNRCYSTGMTDERKFAVFAHDASTGRELWKQVFDTGPLPTITRPNTQASSTPCADAERVYVHFSTLGLLALDARDGHVVWKYELPRAYYLLGWGTAQSPVLYQDMLIYNQDDDLGPFLLALDKKTGKLRWKTPREDMLAGYAAPVVCTAQGRTDLVIAGSGKMQGYDPAHGHLLWSCNSLLRTIMVSPVVRDDMIYISLESYGDTNRVLKYALLEWKDTNQDGKLARSELDPAFYEKFDKADTNRDGVLAGDELDHAFQSPKNMSGGGKMIQAIRGGGLGDVTKTHLAWNLTHAAPSNIASPLVYENRLFLVKKGGLSAAFDPATGKELWAQKRINNLGNYYASPIAGDGKVYVMGENGFLVVLHLDDKPTVLAKNDLGESCVATPAIADGRLFVRTVKKLYCFAEPPR